MKLDINALNLISIFESENHAAYAVGGCVRDAVMKRSSNDTDIAVSCTPDITIAILSKNGIRYVETGLKHGTVTAVIDKSPYEITTFRTDGDYTDSRHPDSVTFVTSVNDDLSRRDFTINAMAYSPNTGIVDLFGGVDDIQNGIIRTVGNPDLRFSEDALRILRALRFSAVLGFDIEPVTARSVEKNADSLLNVARERITAELEKLLCGQNAVAVLKRFYDVFCKILDTDVFDANAVGVLPLDFALRLAAISDGHSLVLSNAVRHRVNTVRENKDIVITPSIVAVRRLMSVYGVNDTCDILTFTHNTDALALVDLIVDKQLAYSVAQLDINGNDLMKIGFRGADIKNTLRLALDAVIDGKVQNENEKLLDYIKLI